MSNFIRYDNFYHNVGALKDVRTCRRGTCVNLAGDVSRKAFWRRGHRHGVLKEEQELTMLRVNKEQGEGISRYRSSNRQKVRNRRGSMAS